MKIAALILILFFSTLGFSAQSDSEESFALNLEKEKKIAATNSDSPLKSIAAVIIFALLGTGGFIYIKRNSLKSNGAQTQIKILTQHYLGPKKSLAIVRVAGESILIGITDQNINMIKSLSFLDEDIPEEVSKNFHEEFSALGMNS